ncbi:uracil-DNA glycosylase family protein [Curtobacterium sp. RRHDQ10]|uniref:uracil-DNA glycosylase family protein n=1 Tax=Curtobacterium phyllosphaerae TaxID=3413379 RepID=UPI003BF21B6A
MSTFDRLRAEVAAHPSNAWATAAGWAPLLVGDPSSRVLIISQAPGRRAQETGVPWNDASGRLLRSWLGVTDDEFYDPRNVAIVPMDFYYPGKAPTGDLPPRPDFAPRWHPRVLAELRDVRLTILVGAHAQRHHLGPRAGRTLTDTVRAGATDDGPFPIVHPSPLAGIWRRRNPWFEADVVPLLRARVRSALDDD